MVIYNKYYLPEFLNQARKYRHLKEQLEKKINLLAEDPYKNCKSELLVGNLKGFRSARLTKSIRVIFSICEECQNRNFQQYIQCSYFLCTTLDPKTIVFLTLDVHDKAYNR